MREPRRRLQVSKSLKKPALEGGRVVDVPAYSKVSFHVSMMSQLPQHRHVVTESAIRCGVRSDMVMINQFQC